MRHSYPWKDDFRSVGQEITRLLWCPNDYYRVLKSPLLDPIVCHLNLGHTLTPYLFKNHFNIILPCKPVPLTRSLPLRFFRSCSVSNFLIRLEYYMSRLFHPSRER